MTFLPSENGLMRNDTLSLGGASSLAHIVISWIPFVGTFYVSTSLPPVIFPGKIYNATVFVNSTYQISRKVIGALSQWEFLSVTPSIDHIRPNVLCPVATVSLLFVPSVMQQFTISDVFHHFVNYSYQSRAWSELWSSPVPLEASFTLHLHPDSNMRIAFAVVLGRSSFQDVDMPAGYVLPRTNITRFLDVRNTHDCAVAFHGLTFDAVAGPGETISVPIRFAVARLGEFAYLYPITTNITAPFYLNISGVVVLPKLRFVDPLGQEIQHVKFRDGNWTHSVYLVNRGKTGVSLSQTLTATKAMHMASNCSDFLELRETCELHFSVQLGFVVNDTELYTFAVKSAGVVSSLMLDVELSKHRMEWNSCIPCL
jgi:hypothetical protein